jgi:hypothetical protein
MPAPVPDAPPDVAPALPPFDIAARLRSVWQ